MTYYVQGYAGAENLWRARQRDPAAEGELRRRAQEHLDHREERYPTLARYAGLGDDDFDASFRLGLETVLDGIEVQIRASSRQGGSGATPSAL